jgi:hypothetical protein
MAEELKGPLATMLGTYYPKNYVVAVLPDAESANQSIAALRKAGWGDGEIEHYTGDFVLAHHAAQEEQRGLLETIGSAFASDERVAYDQYLDEAKRGRHFITVFAPTLDHAHKVRDVLATSGAFGMRHYGDLEMTDLLTTE